MKKAFFAQAASVKNKQKVPKCRQSGALQNWLYYGLQQQKRDQREEGFLSLFQSEYNQTSFQGLISICIIIVIIICIIKHTHVFFILYYKLAESPTFYGSPELP